MPPKKPKPSPAPTSADYLAEAAAVWAAIAPEPKLAEEPAGPVYYTAEKWGAAHGLTRCTAQRRLDALTVGPEKKLTSELYRVDGHRQKLRVYWPVGVDAPG